MSDVFVSYKAEDRKRVKPLVDALQAEGFSVWWDEQIGGGAAWRSAIEAELNAAKCVIVIWSNRSVGPDGTFVQDEATRAQQRHVYVPVLIDKVHLPLGFGETQALPLTGWKGDRADARYEAVLAAVRRNVGGKRRASQSPIAQPQVSRRAVIAGGVVGAAAIAGAGAWALLKPGSAEAASSIAVLPFENLSGDPRQAYFAEGIAEEVRNALTRIGGLKVVGRTSSDAVRNDDAETAAKKLGVATILTGSVRQSPSTIRISAELVDGRTGLEKWSNSYDRPPGDAIRIQTDIAENVARSLSAALGTAARAAITLGGTENVAAQNLLFKAIQTVQGGEKDNLRQAIALVEQALAIDPNYADAYAHKALFTNWYASTFAANVPELVRLRSQAMQSAKIALKIAPDLAAAHHALAEIYRVVLNLPPALGEFERAVQLSPGLAGAIIDYAYFVSRIGRSGESLALSEKAITLDPLNIVAYATRVVCLSGAHRFAEAVTFAQEVERSKPDMFKFPEVVGFPLLALGRLAEAQHYFAMAPADNYNRIVGESTILARTGRKDEVTAKIAALRQFYGDAASYQYGQVYAQLGDRDAAFGALGRAWAIRDSGLINLKVDLLMEPLHGDARFGELVQRLNFPA
jgi:TolB-like protein/Tfp pilus assembly protein PilF